MHNQHIWTERTDEGLKREVWVTKFGGKWKIQTKVEGEMYWTTHDNPSLSDVKALRDVLFRKYQRKRAAWHEVLFLDEWIQKIEKRAEDGK